MFLILILYVNHFDLEIYDVIYHNQFIKINQVMEYLNELLLTILIYLKENNVLLIVAHIMNIQI
jgi:hypothetical protein